MPLGVREARRGGSARTTARPSGARTPAGRRLESPSPRAHASGPAPTALLADYTGIEIPIPTNFGDGQLFEKHHILQRAAMEQLFGDAYDPGAAIVIPLMGGAGLAGSPHQLTQVVQKGEKIALETIVPTAKKALEAAGCRPQDVETIMKAVEQEIKQFSLPIP